MGLGGVILDEAGTVVRSNDAAHGILVNRGPVSPESLREGLKHILRQADRRFSIDKESWVMIPRDGQRPLVVRAMPVGESTDPYSRTVLVLVDLGACPQPSPTALQSMFSLTEAEADLTVRIACGSSPSEIAKAKGVKLTTIRSQLASVFAKTQTSRQTDLVALISRIAILP